MTLAELLAREALGTVEAVAVVRAVAAALAELHARGRAHGAVHPGSILVDGETATLAPAGEPRPGYQPPEQARPGPPDARGDVYALGCVFFECLTGRPLAPVARADVVRLCPPPHGDLVARMTAPRAEERPANASYVLAELPGDAATTPLPSQAVAPVAAPAAAAPGGELPFVDSGAYTVEGEIAQGGLGRVLRARDQRMGRTVALKESLPGRSSSGRFVREALLTGRLEHPGIVPVYEAGRWPTGEPFYAMKLVSGRSLQELIDGCRSLSERLALLPNVLAVAETLAYAHSKRVIHRDVKPANVVVGAFGETVVIDWGLAKDLTGADEALEKLAAEGPAAELTSMGAVMGTPQYMPPEQARGEPVDERADVYALGALLYQVLAGVPPYRGAGSQAVVRAVLAGPPPPLADRQAGLPHELVTIVDKAMARDPAARYPTARELAADLRRFQTGQLVGAHRYTAWMLARRWLRRNRVAVAVAAVALVALAAGGALGLTRVLRARADAERRRGEAEEAQRQAEQRTSELILSQAASSLDRDPTASLAWLKLYPEDGPGWAEARDIIAQAVARGVARHVLRGPVPVSGVAVTRDGRLVAAGGEDGSVALWDTTTRRRTLLGGHTATVRALAFAPDGKTLVTGSKDRTLRLWELGPAPRGRVLGSYPTGVPAISFDARGDAFAFIGGDGEARVRDVATGRERLLGKHPLIADLAFVPDGSAVATVGWDKVLRLWPVAGGEPRVLAAGEILWGAAVAPDGSAVAAADETNLYFWSLPGGEPTVLREQPTVLGRIAFSPDGRLLAIGGKDAVRLWDPRSGELTVLPGHAGAAPSLAFAGDGTLVTGSADGTVRVWEPPPPRRSWHGMKPTMSAPVFTRDGRHVIYGGGDGRLVVRDLSSGNAVELAGHTRAMSLALSPDGRTLVSADRERAFVWDLAAATGRPIWTTADAQLGLSGIRFSADGRLIGFMDGQTVILLDAATLAQRCALPSTVMRGTFAISPDAARVAIARDAAVLVADVASCAPRELYRHAEVGTDALAFSPDGGYLASGGGDNAVGLYGFARGQARMLAGHTGNLEYVVFSPDGRQLASAGLDRPVRLWDVASGALVTTLRGHRGWVRAPVFSPDGEVLITGGEDGDVRLWNLRTGENDVLRGHVGLIGGLALSPDGRQLATTGQDGALRIWPVDPSGGRPADPARLHAWLDGETTAEIDEERRATTR